MTKFLSLPLIIAGISGIAMAIQGTLNSILAEKTSLTTATLIVHIIGSLIAFLAFMFIRKPQLNSSILLAIPWYLYLGGILSVIIVGLVAVSIPKVGVCNATTSIIIGQVGMAIVIDHFGWFGVKQSHWSMAQFIGLGLFAAGAKLLFR